MAAAFFMLRHQSTDSQSSIHSLFFHVFPPQCSFCFSFDFTLASRILNLGLLPIRFPLIGLEFPISPSHQFFVNFISNWSSFGETGGKLQSNRNAISSGPAFHSLLYFPQCPRARTKSNRTHRAPVLFYPGVELLSIFTLILCTTSTPRKTPIRGLATAVCSVMDTGLQLNQ